MFQIITTKGRKSAESLSTLAVWIAEFQPSSVRIIWGDIEAEVEYSGGAANIEDELRSALRMEEADRLNLTVENGNIYLTDIDADDRAYVRLDMGAAVVVNQRRLRDDETLASLLENV